MHTETHFPHSQQHTVLAVYLVGLCAALTATYDSTQEIIQRYHINKKWWYLYGVTCLFAYLYVRPLIRKQLGSASRGYINWSSVYIAWLLSAVFYHMPSLDSMGIDIKADISLLLTTFLLSLCVLGLVQAAYGLAVLFKLADPWLLSATDGARAAWPVVVLHSMTLAVACSTYYSFCGNAATAADGSGGGGSSGAYVKELVCGRWLPPVTTTEHPAFSSWVLYGEPTGAASSSNSTCPAASNGGEFGADWSNSSGTCAPQRAALIESLAVSASASQAISPVFTMWLTLIMMFGANCLADYQATAIVRSAHSAHLHNAELRRSRLTRHSLRRKSADLSRGEGGWQGDAQPRNSMEALFSAVVDTLPANLWSPTTGALKAASNRLLSWRDDSLVGLAALARDTLGGPMPFRRVPPPQAAPKLTIPADAPEPSFLPMFPWYSGTSADLLKTLFDLLISVKLFLGRFDMRTMQVATGTLGNGPDPAPQDGDGFTYEHLAHKDELWFDFCADTGDGGDPTYAVARCMAAPQLQVTVPEYMLSGQEAPSEECDGEVTKILPRGQLLVHGGDLAYPNPTDETYEQRLFRPYEGALPPPSHVHPGHLVVNKPDLPPQYWAGLAPCKCGGTEQQRQCKLCCKAEALRLYEGPSCFMVPGNHDWIDGLETFQRHIQNKGWIGGWLLPQEKSYFALRLPHGWWLFGIDLALVDDIDMCQYRYFARVAEERMGEEDQAIIVMHCPTWLVDWFWGSHKCQNLRQLIRGPLRGRARMNVAGDLHFFMRHSFKPYTPTSSPSLCPSMAPSELSTPLGASPQGMSPTGSRAPTPTPSVRAPMSPSQLHQTLMARLTGRAGSSGAGARPGAAAPGSPSVPPPAAAAAGQAGAQPGGQQAVQQQPQQVQAQGAPQQQGTQQQQQGQGQQLVFGRALEMEFAPAGASPAGGSPLGGSPTVPSMLLQAVQDEAQAHSQRPGSRWSAAASLAAAAMGRRRTSQPGAASLAPISIPPGGEASDSGVPDSPTSEARLQGLSPGKAASAPVPVAGSRKHVTLPILSPIHGSQLELSGLMLSNQEAQAAVEAALEALAAAAAAKGTGNGSTDGATAALLAPDGADGLPPADSLASSSAPSLQQVGASPAAPPPAASNGELRHHDSAPGALDSAVTSSGSSPPAPAALPPAPPGGLSSWWPGLRGKARSGGSAATLLRTGSDASSTAGGKRGDGLPPLPPQALAGEDATGSWHLNDPEHLVVSGSGGGFLHPTHVFCNSRFRPVHDPAAGPVFVEPTEREKGKGVLRRSRSPSSSSLYSLSHAEEEAAAARPAGGEYRCARAFPTPEESLRLGRRNVHMFRITNNRFDIIGGMLYYFLVVSVLPRCSGVAEILDAGTVMEAVRLFAKAGWDTVATIVLESYISLVVLFLLFLMCLGFARSGGIGAMDGVDPSLRRRPEFHGSSMAVRARVGGMATQLAYATAHCLAHLTAAVGLLLLLELGIETVMKYEHVGEQGYHSLYKWYRRFEALHFPDPVGLRLVLQRWTLGLYPNGIKWLMAVFDVPEAICVSRTAICTAGRRLAQLTRLQAVGFYAGVLAYYWLLATPTVAFLFGCYLYLSVNVFHVHYDEAFSSLQVPHFKGFLRFHITRSGDLEMFSLGLERTPFAWREDPRWRTPQGGGNRSAPAHKAKYPSRWLPVEEKRGRARMRGRMLRAAPPPESCLKVVDYLLVPRYRHGTAGGTVNPSAPPTAR